MSTVGDHSDMHFKASNIFCAAGPFALVKKSDDGSYTLDYAPLETLFGHIRNSKHASSLVLLLLGPFVDSDSVISMARNVISSPFHSFEQLFKEEISIRIGGLLSSKKKIKVILIPSQNDVIHDYVFPQAALSRDVLAIPNVLLHNLPLGCNCASKPVFFLYQRVGCCYNQCGYPI